MERSTQKDATVNLALALAIFLASFAMRFF
jgi:hypothetical protein